MSNIKTKVLLFGFCVLSLFCNLSLVIWISPAYAEDKIVAVVNNEVITQKDLNDFFHFMAMQLSREYKGRELEKKLASIKADLLNRLIEDKLILQEANKEKIALDETRIKAKINEIKKKYETSAGFQAELMSQGLTQADIENKIREQFLMYAAVERNVRSKISVKPEEITSFYENNKKEFSPGEKREFIAFALGNEDLASSFSYNLKIGKTPEDLARRYPFTANNLSAVRGENLKKEIEEAVFELGVNEVSGSVKVDDKYYVFKLINIIPPEQLSLKDVQYKIQTYLFERKMQEDMSKWLDELKSKSYIKINQN